MNPIVLFFILGIVAGLIRGNLKLPGNVSQFLGYFLLLSIGLKGGIELYHENLLEILPKILAVGLLGVILPIAAFPVLNWFGRLNRADAASMAVYYGSVSVGTFAVCISYLKSNEVFFESYVPVFVVVLEMPAILIGLMLAKGFSKNISLPKIAHEVLSSQAILLLTGGLFIGALSGPELLKNYTPFFFGLFDGVLALFLIDMGGTVSERIKEVIKNGPFLLGFGIAMPLFGGLAGLAIAFTIGLSIGGAVVLATLGASASYIAVPAAMKISLPEANLGLSLGSSLGVTFPFNILFGIPLYLLIAQTLWAL